MPRPSNGSTTRPPWWAGKSLDVNGLLEGEMWRFTAMEPMVPKARNLTRQPATENDHDPKHTFYDGDDVSSIMRTSDRRRSATKPFAGHIGGSQEHLRNAAPIVGWKELLDLHGFLDGDLWRFAGIEAFGTMLLTFVSAWLASHPLSPESAPTSSSGVFGTPAFLGPLVGGITIWLLLMLLIYSFSGTSGGHLNPLISIATFFARLITLPRMILYIVGQIIGAALAGLALTMAYGSTSFAVGGCNIDLSLVPVEQAFVIEFMFTIALISIAFGVGLDPKQASIFGGTLSPCLIGVTLGLLVFGSSFTRPGYEGAALNPARCFGVYAGIGFPTYHWIHWIAPIVASIAHGAVYYLVPLYAL